MVTVEILRPVLDPPGTAALERQWRALEAESDPSFFQTWTWIGCQVETRFDAPVLLRARAGDATVGLALCNAAPRRLASRALHLHETGQPALDRVFVEHNAPLLARGQGNALAPMLAAALRHGGCLRLSGVPDAVLDAARTVGRVHDLLTRPAPYAELNGGVEAWLARLGAATRQKLRRDRRRHGAGLALRRAEDVPEALAFLEALVRLHQATWVARGQPGAFADPRFVAFHRALVGRGVPRGEVDLLRLQSADGVLGYLYNFRLGGRVCSYQSGFDYDAGQQSPGLACHHAAIERAATSQDRIYDFLAGEARYKSNLATATARLHWLELVRPFSPRDVLHICKTIYRKSGRLGGERDDPASK